ncbi:Hypothetical protein R9X50_00321900 [Acrodontium crateriforme]|uniref:Uncharacterized protein n=1 Tax=Acrodontium crateriforme TaxID=150365 RepID=A0AAQ3M8M6_9PEZI|nr:Hypothetical protein R9X50_00321900 [Acrodontium crateriforme]
MRLWCHSYPLAAWPCRRRWPEFVITTTRPCTCISQQSSKRRRLIMDGAAGPVFRANKRRKILRQRPDSDDEPIVSRLPDKPLGASNVDDEDGGQYLVTFQNRKAGNRKNGIGFYTNLDKRQPAVQDSDRALELLDQAKIPEQNQVHRFVKPTGKTGVVDDRHMVAFVDSKLAELNRSEISTSASNILPEPKGQTVSSQQHDRTKSTPVVRTTQDEVEEVDLASFQSRSARPSSKHTRDTTKPPARTRRGAPSRGADDMARDAMVDAIMREAQVPLYDHSTSSAPVANDNNQGIDNDEAIAEAFKAEFFADLARQQHRRQPAPTAGGSAPNGPKLGGSRQQRERMKAYEEAKAATGKK